MATSCWYRSRRVAAAAGVLTVIAVVTGAVILALEVGVPDAWWPHTGRAFAADTRTAHHDPCALIVGPAKAYCKRGATTTASAEHRDVAGAAWRLGTAGAGMAALVMWRVRHAAGQRRR
ncbi:hypothetical protein KBP30_41330 [Streptomyces sp. Go40/10]|uniref:hypothetical protein n=1 Tax=Streptomyces sp. Go40/10 TaxID=2825844 RepID=UPI001E291764|nr:hypothetical protein [Streptomyces sp. Go40/10]UFQ99767.1 hypothetical protein KBP30_00275 [Streptomyces sp. Go40/10]UFR07180.1 hypothetical protein KBP30_41330 [Streptomyces sp. Go40/10]